MAQRLEHEVSRTGLWRLPGQENVSHAESRKKKGSSSKGRQLEHQRAHPATFRYISDSINNTPLPVDGAVDEQQPLGPPKSEPSGQSVHSVPSFQSVLPELPAIPVAQHKHRTPRAKGSPRGNLLSNRTPRGGNYSCQQRRSTRSKAGGTSKAPQPTAEQVGEPLNPGQPSNNKAPQNHPAEALRKPPEWMVHYHNPKYMFDDEASLEAALARLSPLTSGERGASTNHLLRHSMPEPASSDIQDVEMPPQDRPQFSGGLSRPVLPNKAKVQPPALPLAAAMLLRDSDANEEDVVDLKGYPGRNKGWNYQDLKEILHTHRLCTAVEEEPAGEAESPESDGDSDDSDGDSDGGAAEEAEGEEPRMTKEELEALRKEEALQKQQALQKERQEQERRVRELLPSSEARLPSLWPPEGSNEGPSGRLHPWLLSCCSAVGDHLLMDVLTKCKLEGNTKVGMRVRRQLAARPALTAHILANPYGISANGLEELLLMELRRTGQPRWKPPHLEHTWAIDDALGAGPDVSTDEVSRLPLPSARTLPLICLCVEMSIPALRQTAKKRGQSQLEVGSTPSRSLAKAHLPEHPMVDTYEGRDGGTGSPGFAAEDLASVAPARCETHAGGRGGQEPGAQLLLRLPVMSDCDVPGILHVLPWSAAQFLERLCRIEDKDQRTMHRPEGSSATLGTTHVRGKSGRSIDETHFPLSSPAVSSMPQATLAAAFVSQLILTGGNSLKDGGIATLVLGLRAMPHVTALDLSHNFKLTWRSCGPLAELLDNTGPDPHKDPKNVEHYPKHTIQGPGASRLSTLLLDGVPVGDLGVELLCGSLVRNRHLRILSLQRAGLTHAGVETLSSMLLENCRLEELRLRWNQALVAGAKALGDAIDRNHSLLRLDISNNGLTDAGGTYMAKAMQNNSTLQELDLSSNSLGPSTCLILGDALSNSKSLRVLLLNGNPLTYEGGMHLIRGSAAEGCVVERLGLQAASFTEDTWDGKQRELLFDFEEPQGNYVLDLSQPDKRQVAAELTQLFKHHGPKSWQNGLLNGKPFEGPRKKDRWPERIPEEGELRLTFVPQSHPPTGAEPMRDDLFRNICLEVFHPTAVDIWRMELLEVLTRSVYFSAKQARTLAEAFEWQKERMEAVIQMFPRVLDAGNMDEVMDTLSKDKQLEMFSKLGMAAFFRPENPTGRYFLNLSRQLDRVVALRLMKQAEAEMSAGVARTVSRLNFRNATIEGEPLVIDEPHVFTLPLEGSFKFDFITYSLGTIHDPMASRAAQEQHSPIDSVNFSRLIGAVKTLCEWEYTQLHGHPPEAAGVDGISKIGESSRDKLGSDKPGKKGKGVDNNNKDTAIPPLSVGEGSEGAALRTTSVLGDAPKTSVNVMRSVVMRKVVRHFNPFSFLEVMGVKSLLTMLNEAEADIAAIEEEADEGGIIGDQEYRNAVEQADAGAKALVKELEDANRSAMARDRWKAAAIKVLSLELAWDGLAEIWDSSVIKIDPLSVVRMFSGRHYCSCDQLLRLVSAFDPMVPEQSLLRVNLTHVLFTRVTDPWHFADVLRQMSPPEQVQTIRRIGFLNCIFTDRRDLTHLNGICFIIRMSVQEETDIGKTLADYIVPIPNPARPGESTQRTVFSGLMINGEPTTLREDQVTFWNNLVMMAKDRPRPDETCDPEGTLEFQLVFPQKWMRYRSAIKIQGMFRKFKAMRVVKSMRDQKVQRLKSELFQGSAAAQKAANLLSKVSLAPRGGGMLLAAEGLASQRSAESQKSLGSESQRSSNAAEPSA